MSQQVCYYPGNHDPELQNLVGASRHSAIGMSSFQIGRMIAWDKTELYISYM
jgi:hypothetical protein